MIVVFLCGRGSGYAVGGSYSRRSVRLVWLTPFVTLYRCTVPLGASAVSADAGVVLLFEDYPMCLYEA